MGIHGHARFGFVSWVPAIKVVESLKAHSRVTNFFKLQKTWPEIFENFSVDTIRYIFEAGIIEVMPNRDMDGVTVVVFRSSKWNPETMCIHEAYRAITLLFEYLLLE